MNIEFCGKQTVVVTYGSRLDPKKPSLLLIHGAGMNASVWSAQGRYFAFHGWNAVAPDLPGHGGSEGPPLASVDAMAEWIVGLAGELDLGGVVLAGHSMGSLVALEAAAQLGPSCRALILLGSTETMPVHPALLEAAAEDRSTAGAMIANWGLQRQMEKASQPVPGSNLHWSVRRILDTGKSGTLAMALAACNEYKGAAKAAAAIDCPVLLLVGGADRMSPVKGARSLAGRFPSAEIRTNEGAEHMMLIEQPRATLKAMRDFLSAERIATGALP